jgi:serine/threonine-protein kinase
VIVKICADPIPKPSALAPDLGSEVDRFFERAFSRDLAGRFQSAREFAVEFSNIAGISSLGSATLSGASRGTLSSLSGIRERPRDPPNRFRTRESASNEAAKSGVDSLGLPDAGAEQVFAGRVSELPTITAPVVTAPPLDRRPSSPQVNGSASSSSAAGQSRRSASQPPTGAGTLTDASPVTDVPLPPRSAGVGGWQLVVLGAGAVMLTLLIGGFLLMRRSTSPSLAPPPTGLLPIEQAEPAAMSSVAPIQTAPPTSASASSAPPPLSAAPVEAKGSVTPPRPVRPATNGRPPERPREQPPPKQEQPPPKQEQPPPKINSTLGI